MSQWDPTRGDANHAPTAKQDNPLELRMESALSPREIQARIRGGESVEQVAREAGMGLEWVEPFAVPVLAEREYVAGQARAHLVRRGSETIAHRTLGQVIADRLLARRVDLETLKWDAWRIEGRRWMIRLDYDSGKSHREALFIYDTAGRFSVPDNDDARWLIGLQSASHGPQPGRRRAENEAEPTVDLNDDLALVRVVQPAVDEAVDPEDTMPMPDLDDETDDAYAPGELAEINGLYDIVPARDSGLDVLYDMLSSFDEDSVQIYSGLIRPAEDGPATPVLAEPEAAKPEPEPAAPRKPSRRPATPAAPAQVPEPAGAEATEQEIRTKRKRAQVPSWDEIMFGAPPKKN